MSDDIRLGLSFPSARPTELNENLSPVQEWVLGVARGEHEDYEIALTGQLRRQSDGKYLLFSAEPGKVFENAPVVAWMLEPV